MGVFTRLGPDQLASVLGAWGLAGASAVGVPEGSVNTWYRVDANGRRFYLRVDERDDDAAVATELAVLDALRALPVPRLVATRDGHATTRFGEKPCLLFEALEGTSHPPPELTPARLASLGEVVAAMHRAPVPAGLAPHRFHPRRVVEALYASVRDRTRAEHPEAAAVLDAVFAGGWAPYEFASLPRAVVHGDLFHDNVLYVGDAVTGVLDFEAAGEGARLFDLAVAVHALCFDAAARRFVTARARSLLDAYAARASLTDAERAAWPGLLRFAGARFLVTRLRDFEYRPGAREAGTWKDFREYLHHLDALGEVDGLLPG